MQKLHQRYENNTKYESGESKFWNKWTYRKKKQQKTNVSLAKKIVVPLKNEL